MTTYGISRPRPVTTKALALLVGATALMLAGVAYGTRPTEQRSAYEAEERSDVVKVAMAADSSSGSMDATVKEGVPDYHPQPRGKTRVRVRPTDRAGHTLPIPLVLSPDHVADTASPDPSLFWHIDSVPPAHVKIIFTLNQESRIEPLVEVQLPRVQRVGIQRIRLAEFGVKLDLGVEYNWSVALATGAGEWSGDVFTTGYIRRVAAPPEMNREQQPASVNTYASGNRLIPIPNWASQSSQRGWAAQSWRGAPASASLMTRVRSIQLRDARLDPAEPIEKLRGADRIRNHFSVFGVPSEAWESIG